MASQNFEVMRGAIQKRQEVVVDYKLCRRVFLPFVLGHGKSGDERALCYQVGGQSRRGLEPTGSADNWRCCSLDKLRIIETRDPGGWYTPPNYDPQDQRCVSTITIHVPR